MHSSYYSFLISYFLICFLGVSIHAQGQATLSGRIVDDKGEPLIGTTLLLQGTTIGTASDINGNFMISDVPTGAATLVISYIGFFKKTVQITVTQGDNKLGIFTLEKQPVAFDAITIKATRAGENDPITYTNVEKEEIDRNNLGQDVPFLLRWTPSVVVTSDAGTGIGYTGIRIRGTDPTRINVTINGVPLNDAESQGVFWVNLPDFASTTDNVQIQRGVGTSTNGPAAFGATVSLNTNTLHTEPYAEIATSLGSFNTRRANISFGSGLINNQFTFDGRVSRINSDGYIDRAFVDLESFYLSGAYIGKKSSLRANIFSGNEVTYQAWNGVPAQFINDENLRTFNTAGTERPGEPHDNEVDDYTQTHYQLLYTNQINKNTDLSLTGNYTKGRGFFELYQGNANLSDFNRTPIQIGRETIDNSDLIERRWLDNDFYFGSAALNFLSDNQNWQFSLGTGYSYYRGDHFGEVIWARFAGESELNDRYYENEGIKNDFNIFGKTNYQIAPKLNGFLDLQYRRVDYEFEGFNETGNAVTQTATFNFFNPKVGLSYLPNPTTNLYAYFGVANKEPNRNDLTESSPTSRPSHETLFDTELGIKKSWNRAVLNANIYYMAYDNQLVLTGALNDVGANTRVNVPDSYRLGIELVGGFQATKNLDLNTAITLSSNKIQSFTEFIDNWDTGAQEMVVHEDTDLAFSPSAIVNTDIRYEFFPNSNKNLNISLLSKYVGSQFIDNTSNENTKLDGYFFSDIRLAHSFKTKFIKEVGITFLIRNIFDAQFSTNAWTYRYISAGYDGRGDDPYTRLEDEASSTYNLTGFFPQARRNFLVGLNLRF